LPGRARARHHSQYMRKATTTRTNNHARDRT
jgi:hypothetical protein